jgi:hypothetical protein
VYSAFPTLYEPVYHIINQDLNVRLDLEHSNWCGTIPHNLYSEMDDPSTSSQPPPQPGICSNIRNDFFRKLCEEIPEKDRETFDADPNFTMAPPGISKNDSTARLAVPQTNGYKCTTQKTISRIVIGLGDSIPRWNKDATIKWAAAKTGYPSNDHARYATYRFAQAANDWNSHRVGVTFEWVTDIKQATFLLEYGGSKGDVLAEAFFPNSEPLNVLFVYKGALQPSNLDYLKNVFLHELGHVLGLRHEFALEKEGTVRAVRFGTVNPLSVMSYTFPPNIQPSDEKDTKDFYDFDGKEIGGLTMVEWKPGNQSGV